MTRYETPREPDGTKLCAWCGDPIKQSGVGRPREYCSRTHREYAYRSRREIEIRLSAYARGKADGRPVSSTVGSEPHSVPTVDETRPAGQRPIPPPAAPAERPPAPAPAVAEAIRALRANRATTQPR